MTNTLSNEAAALIGVLDHKAKASWLVELANPDAKQAKGKLKQVQPGHPEYGGHCCLGLFAEKVAGCEVRTIVEENDVDVRGPDGLISTVVEEVIAETPMVLDPDLGRDINSSELLDQRFADRYGITGFVQHILSHLNDGQSLAYGRRSHPAEVEAVRFLLQDDVKEIEELGGIGMSTVFSKWHCNCFTFAQIAKVVERIPATPSEEIEA